MTLNELLEKVKKKKTVSLYRIYSVGNIDETDVPILKTNASGDIFAISPKAAFEALLDQNKELRDALISNTLDNIKDTFNSFGDMLSKVFDTPPIGLMDKPSMVCIPGEDGEITFMPGKCSQIFVVEFKFNLEELARLPQCYNLDGEEQDPRPTGAGLIYLTILDRYYEMDIKAYKITAIKIKNSKDKLYIDDITLELLPANTKQMKEDQNPVVDE